MKNLLILTLIALSVNTYGQKVGEYYYYKSSCCVTDTMYSKVIGVTKKCVKYDILWDNPRYGNAVVFKENTVDIKFFRRYYKKYLFVK